MKKYYILDLPAESIETGSNYPQLEFEKIKEAFKFKHSFPETKPLLSAKLQKKSKLTDILSQASIEGDGLMLSKEICSVITEYKIMNHQLYSCPVKDHRGVIHEYYWMSLVQPELINSLDYEKSEFYLKSGLKNIGEIKLRNFEHYKEIKKSLDIVTIVKLQKTIITEVDYDLFKLPLFDRNIYISPRLKDAISSFTGFIFTEVEI